MAGTSGMARRYVTAAAAAAAASALLAAGAAPARAQVQTAGDLLVNLRASNPSAGTAAWANTGTLGGTFTEVGDPIVSSSAGVSYVNFDPNQAYRGPTAPAGVTGS